MDKLILKNGNEIELTASTSLGILTTDVADVATLQACKDSLTDDNLSKVTFKNDAGVVVGNYENLKLNPVWSIRWIEKGISATFGLSEKTEEELRLDDIEEGQSVQNNAIAELGAMVGGAK